MRQKVLILGLAREGFSLARFLARSCDVTVTDAAAESALGDRVSELRALGVQVVAGGEHPELVVGAGRFFVSPGVPETNRVYQAAVEAGLCPESMTTLFFQLCPAPIVGITGSSGKTTTTGLIGHILREAGCEARIGGNIGDPMLELLPHLGPRSLVVLELSSFQLAILDRSPHVAVVTNITPNHLDRHGTMDAYVAAKRTIVAHQTANDVAVLNGDDETVAAFAGATSGQVAFFSPAREVAAGAFVSGDRIMVTGDRTRDVMPVSEVPLLGRHNLENVLAAVTATAALGVDPGAQRRAVRSFQPAPHRLQIVSVRRGVTFVDDSIATSPARSIVALRALPGPVILIAGGRDKKLPWDDFARLAIERVRALYLIGEAAELIEAAVRRKMRVGEGILHPAAIHRCESLEEAVTLAGAAARPGENVLLSPGCTSYDMFRDFEDRGEAFVRAVEGLHAA